MFVCVCVCVIMSDLLSCFVLFCFVVVRHKHIVNDIFVGNGFSLAVYWVPCFFIKGDMYDALHSVGRYLCIVHVGYLLEEAYPLMCLGVC